MYPKPFFIIGATEPGETKHSKELFGKKKRDLLFCWKMASEEKIRKRHFVVFHRNSATATVTTTVTTAATTTTVTTPARAAGAMSSPGFSTTTRSFRNWQRAKCLTIPYVVCDLKLLDESCLNCSDRSQVIMGYRDCFFLWCTACRSIN